MSDCRTIIIEERELLKNSSAILSHSKTMETRSGMVLLRRFCSPSFVESLRADSGLRAFARLPEREHQLLLNIAKDPDNILILAYTPTGEIVGEVTIAPADPWWAGLRNVYEIAIQVSSNWRQQGIAQQLLALAFDLEDLEDRIMLAMGLTWHWDMEGLGLSKYQYRQLIAQLFARQKFDEYQISEPNIAMDHANIFLARIGNRVELQTVNRFINRLLDSPTLPGL
jgi:GNAT superfamily N-acetyltransferase